MTHNNIVLANEIGSVFPAMPIPERSACAVFAGMPGRVGNTSLEDRAFRAVAAWVRHKYTQYDALLNAYGFTKLQAREAVRRDVYRQINLWKQ
jgi:hypothetical protein